MAQQPIPGTDADIAAAVVAELSKTAIGRRVLADIKKRGIKIYVFDMPGGPAGYYNGAFHSEPPGYNNSIMINLSGKNDVRQIVDSIVHEYRHSTQTKLQKQLYGPGGAYERKDRAAVEKLKTKAEADAYRYEIEYQIEAGRIPTSRSSWVTPDPNTGDLVPVQSEIDKYVAGHGIPDNSTTNVAAAAGRTLKTAAPTTTYRELNLGP